MQPARPMSPPSNFAIRATAPDRLEASGAMSFDNAGQALVSGLALIPNGRKCTVDLSRVTEADSAGLAVLVEWLATARKRGTQIYYEGIPSQLLALARISDLEDILTDGR
jgi:phospholipid transport system transporter-binding protein